MACITGFCVSCLDRGKAGEWSKINYRCSHDEPYMTGECTACGKVAALTMAVWDHKHTKTERSRGFCKFTGQYIDRTRSSTDAISHSKR